MPRRIRDTVGSILALLILLGVLISIDDRVRVRFRLWVNDIVTEWNNRPTPLGDAILEAAQRQGIESTLLMTFLAAGVLLAFLMLRLRT
jgi:hypothetical protein